VTDTGFTNYVPRRTLFVWAVLVALTCTTWAIGGHRAFTPTVVTAAVLALALVKVRFIGSHFMELLTAPKPLRLCFDGYVVAVYVGLMGVYVML
jgi:hypothetical protein